MKVMLQAVTLCPLHIGLHTCHLLDQSESRVSLLMSVFRGRR